MRAPTLLLSLVVACAMPTLGAASDADTRQVERLRSQGYAGLERAIQTGDEELIDAVAGQRDALASGLFWHTDWKSAQSQAKRSGKPILSLRLLGDLREEYTCANSRFFRSLLYSHPEIAAQMRENFVLHWSNERDVPVVTIDFGDGRRVRRTITGNSIHYVLDEHGRPIDALPGVYSPDQFLAALTEAHGLFTQLAKRPAREREALVKLHHDGKGQEEAHALYQQLAAVRSAPSEPEVVQLDRVQLGAGRPSVEGVRAWMQGPEQDPQARVRAAVPMEFAVTKAFVERPILVAIGEGGVDPTTAREGAWVPPQSEEWAAMAERVEVTLHPDSRALILAEQPLGTQSEDLDAMFATLERSVALDTVQNTFLLRPRIRAVIASGEHPDLESLNRVVYDQIFATPASDPWLGLVDPTAYTALDDAGWESEAVMAASR